MGNEFFKLSKVNKIFFKKLSRSEILKFIALRMEPFSLRFEHTFSDLLDLEFRLNPKILQQVWERLFWKFKILSSVHRKLLGGTILYSFTYEESTFIICDITRMHNNLLLHFVRLQPKEPFPSSKKLMEECFIWVFDLKTGLLKYNLWGQNYGIFPLKGVVSKQIEIVPKNFKMLMNLMERNILSKNHLFFKIFC